MRTKDAEKMGEVRALLEREGPHFFMEILGALTISKATLARYLADLKGLGDIEKDDDGRWGSTRNLDANIRRYESKWELDEARAHTAAIMQVVEGIRWTDRGFIHTGEPEWETFVEILAEWGLSVPDRPDLREVHISDFVQHLRSGYVREFWSYLREYETLQRKHAFPRMLPRPSVGVVFPFQQKSYFLEDLEKYGSLGGNALPKVPKADIARARELINMLVGQLDRIAHEAEELIPLKGVCDFCPGAKVFVKNKAEQKAPGGRRGHD